MAVARSEINSARPAARLCAAIVSCTLAGCSTMPGVGGIAATGYQGDGTYVLSAQEQNLGCRQLKERSQSLIEQLKALPARAAEEIQKAPATVATMFGRLFGGPGDGVPAAAEYNRTRAEAVALNSTLAQKGCGSFDLDSQIGPDSIQTASGRI